MIAAGDVRTRVRLVQLLSAEHVDLECLELESTDGSARVKGVLRRSDRSGDHGRVGSRFLDDLEEQIRQLPEVRDVKMELRHWDKEQGAWHRRDSGKREHRRDPRVPLRTPMHWRQKDHNGKEFACHHTETVNLSQSGVAFRCGYCTEKAGAESDGQSERCKLHEFHGHNPEGEALPVAIRLPNGEKIDAKLKVLHVNNSPRTGDECVGAQFDDLSEEARESISRAVEGFVSSRE